MRWLCAIAVIALAFTCAGADDEKPAEIFGARPDPGGNPIGGGKGYKQIVARPGNPVKTGDGLIAALGKAKAKQVVYVDDAAEIDLTGSRGIVIPGGVTLASGRGRKDSKGALLFTTEDKYTKGKSELFCLFKTGGSGVRVTGIRLRGPDPKTRGRYEYINSDGIQCEHDRLEVDNCELWAWSHGGVYARAGKDIHVHHNSIHHCQRSGLGYGVVLNKAEVLIEGNIFDYYRHAIAATGRSPSGYEARDNISLEHATSHVFDMHGGRDRRDGTNVAGDWMKIHHNTFHSRKTPFVIRGRPTRKCEVHHNWFINAASPGRAVRQANAKGNVSVGRNAYTKDKTVK
jgi:hypothetical protein